jgi:hypothetical protein
MSAEDGVGCEGTASVEVPTTAGAEVEVTVVTVVVTPPSCGVVAFADVVVAIPISEVVAGAAEVPA